MKKFIATITGVLMAVVLINSGLAYAASALGTPFPVLIVNPLGGLTANQKGVREYLIDNYSSFFAIDGNIHFFSDQNTTPSFQYDHQAAMTIQADGDILLGSGGVAFDSTRNTAPELEYSDTSFFTYKQTACTVTGGQIAVVGSTATAVIDNPYASGTGVIMGVGLDVATNPTAVAFDIGTRAAGTSLTASGQNIIENGAVASGASLFEWGDNAGNTPILIPPSGQVMALATTDLGDGTSSGACVFKAWMYEYSE